MNDQPKIVITGATGFIGKGLLRQLAASKQYSPVAVVRNEKVRFPPNVEIIRISDLSNNTGWGNILLDVNVIIHAAARVHIMNDRAVDPLGEFRRVNVEGTLRLAQQAAEVGVRRFIFISSIGVNGPATSDKAFDESSALQPNTNYALSKFEAEEKLRSLAATTGMEVVIIRPPLVYAADAPGNFARLLRGIRSGLPLPLALVKNQRSFIARENLVDFIMTCVDHPKAGNQTFLVADGQDLSTPELIRLLAKGMNKWPRLFPVPVSILRASAKLFNYESAFQQLCGSLQVNMTKARELLEWKPPISIDVAMQKAAKEFMEGGGR